MTRDGGLELPVIDVSHPAFAPDFGGAPRRLTTAIDLLLAVASAAVMVSWLLGRPLSCSPKSPVTSWSTASSILIMVSVRQARLHFQTWPMALSLAMTGLVLGGNVSSAIMLAMAPSELWASFPDLELTSAMTSVGLGLFCAYDFVSALRERPRSALIVDDLLIHLAPVPGGLSLPGYILGNPTYRSVHADPRDRALAPRDGHARAVRHGRGRLQSPVVPLGLSRRRMGAGSRPAAMTGRSAAGRCRTSRSRRCTPCRTTRCWRRCAR